MQDPAALPLHGIRVLEFGQIAAGPFTGSLLADLGADVVKVERPDGGDGMRAWPPLSAVGDGEVFSENFASLNRNKRSLTADLKDTGDVARLKELAAVCDVVVENFRPGVLPRLGLGYEALSEVNPRLVYCSISGYGQTGPKSGKGAFDVTVQGFSGLMSVTGEPGAAPVKCGVPVGDFCAGLYAAYTILARLMQARETGRGAHIDCSMVGSLIGVAALQTSEFFGTGRTPQALGSAHPGNDRLWAEVAEAVGMPELARDPRFATQNLRAANQDALLDLLQPAFEKRPAAHWLEEMDRRGVPCAPINSYPEVFEDEHIAAMGIVRPLDLPNGVRTRTTAFPVAMSGYEFEVYRAPPALGADTEDVAADWLGDGATGTDR